jgi:hypothetical protein
MEQLIKIYVLFVILLLISCSNNKIKKVKFKVHETKKANVSKIQKSYKKYSYKWGDTALVSIDYSDGKWVGLTKWKNINVCSPSDTLQPIIFKLVNKSIKVNNKNVSDIIGVYGNIPEVKLHNNNFYIWYITKDNRILEKLNLNNNTYNKYKLKRGDNNIFGIDKDGNYYISETPGLTKTLADKIRDIFSRNINTSPSNFPIGQYNDNLKKVNSFGRWIYTGDIKDKRNLQKDIFLNQRNILCNGNYIYTCSSILGYIEKYDLNGNFIDYLALTSSSQLFNNMLKTNNRFIDMKIVEENLFILFSAPTNALSGICEYPKDKKHFLGIVKINLTDKKIAKEKTYYFIPKSPSKYSPSFTMTDSETLVLPTKEGIEFFKLK